MLQATARQSSWAGLATRLTACCAATQDGNAKLRVAVVGDGSGRPQITGIRGAELSFSSIAISTSEAKLAWLYNIVAALAKTPIQDAITREVAAQVRPLSVQRPYSGRTAPESAIS